MLNCWTTSITWLGTVYAFHKPLRGLLNVNYPKPCHIVLWPVQNLNIFPKYFDILANRSYVNWKCPLEANMWCIVFTIDVYAEKISFAYRRFLTFKFLIVLAQSSHYLKRKKLIVSIPTIFYDSVLFRFCLKKWKANSCNNMKRFIIHGNGFLLSCYFFLLHD
jgi:hypothetical protein